MFHLAYVNINGTECHIFYYIVFGLQDIMGTYIHSMLPHGTPGTSFRLMSGRPTDFQALLHRTSRTSVHGPSAEEKNVVIDWRIKETFTTSVIGEGD